MPAVFYPTRPYKVRGRSLDFYDTDLYLSRRAANAYTELPSFAVMNPANAANPIVAPLCSPKKRKRLVIPDMLDWGRANADEDLCSYGGYSLAHEPWKLDLSIFNLYDFSPLLDGSDQDSIILSDFTWFAQSSFKVPKGLVIDNRPYFFLRDRDILSVWFIDMYMHRICSTFLGAADSLSALYESYYLGLLESRDVSNRSRLLRMCAEIRSMLM